MVVYLSSRVELAGVRAALAFATVSVGYVALFSNDDGNRAAERAGAAAGAVAGAAAGLYTLLVDGTFGDEALFSFARPGSIRKKSEQVTKYNKRQLSAIPEGDESCAVSSDTQKNDEKHVKVKNAKLHLAKTVRVAFGSTTGKSRQCADWVEELCKGYFVVENPEDELDVVDLASYDQDNLEQEDVIIFVVSTWTGGTPPESASVFYAWLEDMFLDFRVDKNKFLGGVKFAVIGLGIMDYADEYCLAAKNLDKMMSGLGAKRLAPIIFVDAMQDIKPQLMKGATNVMKALASQQQSKDVWAGFDNSVDSGRPIVTSKPGKNVKKNNEKHKEETPEYNSDEDDEQDQQVEEELITDLEDVVVATDTGKDGKREMLTNSTRRALSKQGYKIIGSHSAVKLCRWTKNHLRGRGGCYKNGFYGIKSYACCEATPSLACASKCVFCWRHSTNPVGTSFKWKEDDPDFIVEQAIDQHRKMIKTLRGVPGVQPDRFQDAFNVQHCALSLVGEPIMYPRINELVGELHQRDISTFLVTNAVFPEAMEKLCPVTQLYVSVDAATKDALKEVDRPLHKDFWERFMKCLNLLRDKKQRTVFRLTLVKSWNMDEVNDYCKLIELAQPDLVEIKGVTFCGKSDASNLTMANVPYHEEVRKFALAIAEQSGGKYGPACEHVHSCCTLLGKKETFLRNGHWHTWIDYPEFHRLNRRYVESGGKETFTTQDYMAPTPDWAVWGAEEQGFNPTETRFKRTHAAKNNVRPEIGLPKSKR